MTEESTDKTISKFVFSGKKVDWPIWREKFLARSKQKGYKNVLLGRENIPDDSATIDKSTATGKADAKLRELNELAYEDMVLFIDGNSDAGRIAFSIVHNGKTPSLKDGDAGYAWKGLCDKYESKTAPHI